MLESISQIKDKVHASRYEDEGRKTYDVDNIVAELKKDEKFKNFSEGQLYEYAYGLIARHNAYTIKGDLERMGFNTGKPQDPFWSQYTYEEILNMVNDGVDVPKEFVDWANTMQDSDTTAYQIEDSSEDPNAYENLISKTGDVDESDIQKRAQALSSKAQSQEQLIYNRVEEAKPLVNTVQAEKNDLEQNQRLSLQKIESMQNEWKTLDKKFKQGKVLNETEQKRYKELGLMLNDQNNNLMQQVQKVNTDIEELTSQIENIDMLLNVNEKITAEIESVGTKMSWFEGNKNHIILPSNSGNQILGISATFYTAAMGNNLAIDTGLTGINLFFNNLDIENQQGSNLSIVQETKDTVDVINNADQERDTNLKYTTNKQAETQGDESKSKSDKETNNSEVTANKPDTRTENKAKPNDKTNTIPLIEDTKINSYNNAETPIDSESGNINDFAQTVEDSQSLEVKSNVQLQSKAAESASKNPTVNVMDGASNATSANAAQTSEATETSATTDVSAGTETTDAQTVSDTSVETEDPLEAETSQYVSECANRNNAMAQAEQQIQSKVEEILRIRIKQKQEDAQLNAELNKNIAEYEKLAKKVQNGETLSDGDQKRVKALEKALNSNDGTFIVEMQDKVTALTGFASQLRNDIQTTKDNQEYGKEAIAKGKEYAKATLGDRSYLKNNFWFAGMSKEEQYDLLYGKAGESIGRDAIDNGELLVNNATASNEKLSKSLPLAGFAMTYAQQLNNKITETNTKVNSVKENLENSAKTKEGEMASGEGKSTSNSKSSNNNQEVTQEDGKKAEKEGQKAEKDGKDAKKDADNAKKDKQSTDKQIKAETAALKADEKRIQTYTRDSQQINKQFEAMAIEADAIIQAQNQQAQSSQAMPAGPALNSETRTAGAIGMGSQADSQVSGGTSDDGSAKLATMAASIPNLDKRLKNNDKTITTISYSAQSKTKKLTKLYNLKYKQAQTDIKAKEDSIKKREKIQGIITKTGYAFTGTKIAGQLLMLFPWSAAVGAVMFSLGKYGEIACYATNASIDIANGNFAGAIINVGAAALSFASGPIKMNPAKEAVKSAAKEGGKEVAKEGAEQAITATTKEVAAQGAEQALTATTQELVANPIKEAAQASFNAMVASSGEAMKATANAVAQQAAKEAAKEILKENVKNAAIQVAGSAMQTYGQKLQAKQAEKPEQKKQRRLLSYKEKRARQSKMDKIDQTKKVLMSRGQKKR